MAPKRMYEEVGLLEADEDVRRPMSKGRIVGVAVAMVAVVGLVGASTYPKKTVSQMDRLSLAHKALMKAFSKRSLQELAQTKGFSRFSAIQEGKPIGDDGLSIHATVASDPDSGVEKPQIEVEFEAQEGKGKDLEDALNHIMNAMMQPPPEDATAAPERRLEEGGGPLQIKTTDDKVHVTLVPPIDDNEEFSSDLEQGMENLRWEASLKLGRTLDDLYDDNKEHLPFSLHGLQFSTESSFASALCDAMEVMKDQMEHHDHDMEMKHQMCVWLSALTSVNVSYDIRYRDPAELSDNVKTAFPTLSDIMQMGAGMLMGMPPPVKKAVKGVDGLTKGINSIAIRGLPNNFKIAFDCKNFKVSSILKKLIELADAHEAAMSG